MNFNILDRGRHCTDKSNLKLSLLSLLSLKPTQRSLRKTFLLQNKILLPFNKKILLSFLFCVFLSVFLPVFLLFYLSFFFIFPVSLSLSYFIASFSVTFERKKSKKVANRQEITNFAWCIAYNVQQVTTIID